MYSKKNSHPSTACSQSRSCGAAQWALLLLSVITATSSYAEDSEFQLQTLTVTATRSEQTVETVNRPISVVTEQQIQQLQADSVAEIVRQAPNVEIAGGPRASSQTINIRGLSDNKVLQTVDGVRQQFNSGHRPSYFLDPELIASVETVRGPASSLWGSGALGGVVAQTTINGSDLVKPQQQLGGYVKGGYNSNNDQNTTGLGLGMDFGAVDLLLSGYYREGNDIELGNGEDLQGSAERDHGALAKLAWSISESQQLTLSYRQAEMDGTVPTNGTAEIEETSNFLIDRTVESNNQLVDYRLNPATKWLDMQIQLYRNDVQMEERRKAVGQTDQTEQTTLGINLNNSSQFGALQLVYGIDGFKEDFDARRQGIDRPTPPQAESENWGGFVQGIWNVSAVTLELGGRYDYFSTESENLNVDRSDNDFSPALAVSWQIIDDLKITARYDTAFRAPTSEELYTTGTHFCLIPSVVCNSFVSNPDLEAEEAENSELIVSYALNDLVGEDSLTLTANIFRNNVDNFIEQLVEVEFVFFPVPSGGTTTWINVDEARIQGYEIMADYRWQGLLVSLSYAQTHGYDRSTGDDLFNIPADTLKGDISYAFFNQQWLTGVRFTSAQAQKRVNTSIGAQGPYDEYSVADIYTSWEPSVVPGLRLDLSLNNVTDRYYRLAWDQLYQAGREARVAVKYSF